ncbi:sigma 54-interacting transcriptional regulator [Psychrobacillus sp. NEAU-3TGS]|uniref:sigma-54 interaction domain-containing protein n=1 Tax=Psychrobacillus sp. NEAU-3TGS TaxID=2995412 RepID=UPI002495B5C4|nr:sigma 54-interacting transcriptional regulator [Psychrobacillus sp. NEAU-3TGS]MDI2588742.1 sigma 54-interacting transcriptional regulator [Psychrobacillus sp. NEAU-3TGS]
MCEGCHFFNNCPSKAELIQDMMLNGEKFGYLSLVSLSPQNKSILIEQKDLYTEWLTRLKDIIISILRDSNEFKSNLSPIYSSGNYIFGNSQAFKHITELVKKIRNSTSTVLITGETGTGKSMLAKYIHENSTVSNGPLVEINCASIPESLFESELFGYESGAFTNARKGGKKGYFESADNGTLFLDEIAELPIHLQSKLLKVLQDGIIQRVGGTSVKKVNARIIAATNQPLEESIKEKKFRSDLFYRLNVIPITIPPLRERLLDLPLLVEEMKENLKHRSGKYFNSCTNGFMEVLSTYHWPGNLRELENVIEYSMNFETENALSERSLPPYLLASCKDVQQPQKNAELVDVERDIITQKLNIYGYNYNGKQMVAKDLGMSIRTLYRKLEKLQILS